MKKMSLSIFIAQVSCMIVNVTYHNMNDGAPCLLRVILVLAPALVHPPTLPPPLLIPPPVVAAGAEAEAAAAAIAAAAVEFLQLLQQVGAAAAAALPAYQQCQHFGPSIGSNISTYMA